MKKLLNVSVFIILFGFVSCDKAMEVVPTTVQIIPKPQQITQYSKGFSLKKDVKIYSEKEFDVASTFLLNYLQKGASIGKMTSSEAEATIVFVSDTSQPEEGYELHISEEQITIKAATDSGAFYAVQSLRQLIPERMERMDSMPHQLTVIPCLEIIDAPQFKYRGMHLDVARHFFPKEFIKEYIAALAMLKMNYFHWHLTEDQGWRIEIKQFPRLTTHAAYRDETLIGHYNESPQQFDGARHGGFYTQKDVKEIVAFATAHNVIIIPEIEMPGHAQAAISAYPKLGCTGEQVLVATKWGVFENIYCPNQNTFAFLEGVLTEVMDLFPGEYIHIGGDEAPKSQWKKCNHCQKLISDLSLGDEHGLQSYFIRKMEAFINSKGKKIIGWDEILEGGLAPNATVMSWRGTSGAVEAAKEGHDVILTPTSHAYFDYYQADHADEPLAIGGFLPLKKVYNFNPIPEELTESESKYVLGAQGNIWTEYMKTESQVEYMAFPRTLAMSEVVWSGPSENIEQDYPKFLARVENFNKRLDVLDVNYANHLYDIEGSTLKKDGRVFYELTSPIQGKDIRYKMNLSSVEKIYDQPIPINTHTILEAAVQISESAAGRPFKQLINFHKGIKGTVAINTNPHPAYAAGGKEALINGIDGSDTRYGDKEWLGFWGEDLEIAIDLGKETNVTKVTTRFYNAPGQWVYAPPSADLIYGFDEPHISTDLKNTGTLVEATFNINVHARFLTLRIPSYGVIPEGQQGAGNKAWTFIDEIIIE